MSTPNAPTREDVERLVTSFGCIRFDIDCYMSAARGYDPAAPLGSVDAAFDKATAAMRALLDENERLRAQLDEEHDTDRTLLHTLITATLCRLPTEIVGERSWDIYLEENRDKWLGDHRAFGGWLSGRITDALNAAREGA